MEPFYKLEPKANTVNETQKAPAAFFTALDRIIESEAISVVEGKKTVEEALKTLKQKGREELTKARKTGE